MFWERKTGIPPVCLGLDGHFSFSLKDGKLVCYQYYSPFSKTRKEVTILPETPSTHLAVKMGTNSDRVAYFGLDREWLLAMVQSDTVVALTCEGHEAIVMWQVDNVTTNVNCTVGSNSQFRHMQYEASANKQKDAV